jgi:hypothetical protein
VSATSGNHIKWIDRIDVPDYAEDFYETLEEATDGDKTNDWLIDVTSANKVTSDSYGILIRTVKGHSTSKNKIETFNQTESDKTAKYIRAVYDAFKADHPEVFWLSGETECVSNFSYTGTAGNLDFTINIYFMVKTSSFDARSASYNTSDGKTKIYSDIKTRDKNVKSIMDGVSSSASDYNKIKYFNKTLTEKNEYNTDLDNAPLASWECTSALKGTTGKKGPVCEGYAKAFKVLCDEAGIPCVVVTGTGINDSGSQNHMWNYVKLNGKWYAVDVTWNDPAVEGKSGAVTGKESTKWLAVGSSTVINGSKFSESHKILNTISVGGHAFTNQPSLTSSKYSPVTKPAQVKVKSYTSSTNYITLKWGKVSGAAGYRVYRYNSSTKEWETLKTISSGSTVSYKDSTAKAGKIYYYKVRAYKKDGSSKVWGTSSSNFTALTKCSQVKISSASATKNTVTLKWDKVNSSGYEIQQYDSSAKKWVKVKTVSSSTTSYKISKLKKGTTYKFRVRAYKTKGDQTKYGSWSATKSVKTKS